MPTPPRPATDEMLMMLPLPWSFITRPHSRMPRNTPVWLTAIIRFQSSSDVSSDSGDPEDARVVDEDVDATLRLDDSSDDGDPVGFAGHVVLDERDGIAETVRCRSTLVD